MRPQVLLVERDGERGRAIASALECRYECRHVASLKDAALALPADAWAAVVAEYELDRGGSGLEVLQLAREVAPRAFRLFHCARPLPSLMRDVERLAQPHYDLDDDAPDFLDSLPRALDELLMPDAVVGAAVADTADACETRAPVMRQFVQALRAAAVQETPVYLHGEPGTGRSRMALLLRRWRQAWKAAGSPNALREPPPVPVLRVPALRERPQDLPALAAGILRHCARSRAAAAPRLAARALEDLRTRDWRGNLPELADVLERAVRRAGTRLVLDVEHLPKDGLPAWRPSQYAKDDGQRDCVLRQLRVARTVSAAARLEGCSRANYIRMMRRLGIVRADVGTEEESEAGRAPVTSVPRTEGPAP